jgi:hypothetical protein
MSHSENQQQTIISQSFLLYSRYLIERQHTLNSQRYNVAKSIKKFFSRTPQLVPGRPDFLRLAEGGRDHWPQYLPDATETGISNRHNPSGDVTFVR